MYEASSQFAAIATFQIYPKKLCHYNLILTAVSTLTDSGAAHL